MKKTCFALLYCLLLWGCASKAPDTEATLTATLPEPQSTEPTGYYDPDSALEAATGGAVRCYPLTDSHSSDMLVLGDNILLIAAGETGTDLTVLTGEDGCPTANMRISSWLTTETASLHRWDSGISFYEEDAMQTLVLDNSLREVSRIAAPDGLVGSPILSTNRTTLYYCTSDSIRALELETGISRCLKEITSSYQSISGLWLSDTVLECAISDGQVFQTLFLSTETGAILHSSEKDPVFYSSGDNYFASFTEGAVTSHVYGNAAQNTRILNLKEPGALCWFLPEDNAAVAMYSSGEMQIILEYFDLDSGLCTSSLTLNTTSFPWAVRSLADGQVCFLNYDQDYGCTTLYRWDTAGTPTGDETCYTDIYYTRENPDTVGLAECRAYAEQIGSRYGIEVLIHKEAVAAEPYDYDLEYEHLVGVIQRELELLDQNLSRYPDGFLSTLASRFDGLSICIVRSLTGTAEAGSLDTADGIQFLEGYRAYVALAAGSNTEYALHHELCHLIDTVVISESGAYDRWDELNPKGFAYDYDYIANQNRNSGDYLREESRSFIDTYSMSFPKEDRARIMEYAMTEGNASYFQSTTMQAKLKLLCEGIREAFGLRKSPDTFLWEQYLNISLAYTEK